MVFDFCEATTLGLKHGSIMINKKIFNAGKYYLRPHFVFTFVLSIACLKDNWFEL